MGKSHHCDLHFIYILCDHSHDDSVYFVESVFIQTFPNCYQSYYIYTHTHTRCTHVAFKKKTQLCMNCCTRTCHQRDSCSVLSFLLWCSESPSKSIKEFCSQLRKKDPFRGSLLNMLFSDCFTLIRPKTWSWAQWHWWSLDSPGFSLRGNYVAFFPFVYFPITSAHRYTTKR